MIFKYFPYLFWWQISSANSSSVSYLVKMFCLSKYIYCPPHHRLQSANCLSPKAEFSEHETRQCSQSSPVLWRKYPASKRPVSNQTRTRVYFVTIILGKGLTDLVMQEFRQEFRFTTELVQVYNSICTLRSWSSVKRRLQPTPLTFSLVILIAVRARGGHKDD